MSRTPHTPPHRYHHRVGLRTSCFAFTGLPARLQASRLRSGVPMGPKGSQCHRHRLASTRRSYFCSSCLSCSCFDCPLTRDARHLSLTTTSGSGRGASSASLCSHLVIIRRASVHRRRVTGSAAPPARVVFVYHCRSSSALLSLMHVVRLPSPYHVLLVN